MADKFNILNYTAGPLLKSGQTTDNTPAGRTAKADGGTQRGIIGSKANNQYEIFTAGQYSGTTNITVNGKTDVHSNNCVFDKVTSLLWARSPSANVFGTGSQGLQWTDTTNNEDIFEYCDQANLASFAGFTDWRVPNIVELCSLPLYQIGLSPCINQTAFPSWGTGNIWSGTDDPSGGSVIKLNVDFTFGGISRNFQTNRLRIVLVRLGIVSSL